MENSIKIEQHPWPAFMPLDARILMLGTFPPKSERWSMDFFYPNKTNDMWKMMGYIFCGSKDYFWEKDKQKFDLERIVTFLHQHHIALWDTAMKVRRLKDNASDKYLEILEAIDLKLIMEANPTIAAVVATGEKACSVIAEQCGCEIPSMGKCVRAKVGGHEFSLYRMPSTSRAYPLALERKAEYYKEMFVKESLM